MQADNQHHLELNQNRGDDGDPYPGSSGNTTFTSSSAPDSKSHAGAGSCVSVTRISPSAATMTASVAVSCGKAPIKEIKEGKEIKEPLKEAKEPSKEAKDFKDRVEGEVKTKEPFKEHKDLKDRREHKTPYKEFKDDFDNSADVTTRSTGGEDDPTAAAIVDLQTRLAALEQTLGGVEAARAIRPSRSSGPNCGPT